MENIKGNLDKRICDCLEYASNEATYKEFIVESWEFLGNPMTEEEIANLYYKSNEELNEIVEELDNLLWK